VHESDGDIIRDADQGEQVCFIYRLKDGAGAEYDQRHGDVWPDIQRQISQRGIYDYSIFRRGNLVISVHRTRPDHVDVPASEDDLAIRAKWSQSLADLFEETTDADGKPLYARRVFRLD
jgi:L-rhamnose mutarotase